MPLREGHAGCGNPPPVQAMTQPNPNTPVSRSKGGPNRLLFPPESPPKSVTRLRLDSWTIETKGFPVTCPFFSRSRSRLRPTAQRPR